MRRYFISSLLCLTCLACLAQPKVVAHRGYWTTEGSAQNSIASLQKAAEIGCWGSEFDVWMTADGIPVVFHDATIDGIRIEDTTYATLMNHRLQNGEFIPTLQQYLTEAKRLTNCRLIFEIKQQNLGAVGRAGEHDGPCRQDGLHLVQQACLQAHSRTGSKS